MKQRPLTIVAEVAGVVAAIVALTTFFQLFQNSEEAPSLSGMELVDLFMSDASAARLNDTTIHDLAAFPFWSDTRAISAKELVDEGNMFRADRAGDPFFLRLKEIYPVYFYPSYRKNEKFTLWLNMRSDPDDIQVFEVCVSVGSGSSEKMLHFFVDRSLDRLIGADDDRLPERSC